jgi:MoxR-like ATPase
MTYQPIFDPAGHQHPGPGTSTGDRRDGAVYFYSRENPDVVLAVNVALAAGRPLLVRGRSGCGKSSLAPHVARVLGWRYLERVITSRTQAQDLLWQVDHLRRLRDAQMRVLHPMAHYVRPGVLWEAFDPEGAARQTRVADAAAARPLAEVPEEREESLPAAAPDEDPHAAEAGPAPRAVVLLDEIDKADPDVPNNLLVALGSFFFTVEETGQRVETPPERAPLVVLTTNDERDLPEAFLRRCVELRLPDPTADTLTQAAALHFPDLPADHLEALAQQVLKSAGAVSTAEFLDTVRACRRLEVDPASHTWEEVVRSVVRNSERSPAAR